jgi:hypothetical protein
MPPGWQDYVSSPLAEVCAFQWRSAYEAISEFRKGQSDSMTDISYEESISASGHKRLHGLIHFCGTSLRTEDSWNPRMPVAAVSEPRAGKWRKHANAIKPIIAREAFRELAGRFDYDAAQMEFWP